MSKANLLVPVPLNSCPKSISFSRLTKYDECSMLFKLVADDLVPYEESEATLVGNMCHAALEAVYGSEDEIMPHPYDVLVGPGGVWETELAKDNLLVLRDRLQNYAHHWTKLAVRASASYTGKDKIRTQDGRVPKAPDMTKPWKDYAREHGLDALARSIDEVAGRSSERWKKCSLAKVYADSASIMHGYVHPAAIHEILYIELPVSEFRYVADDGTGKPMRGADGSWVTTSRVRGPYPVWKDAGGKGVVVDVLNPFYLPKLGPDGKLAKNPDGSYVFRDDAVFTGYIDLLARDERSRLGVTDHKSNSGDAPGVPKVARQEQFLLYGFMVWQLTGTKPDFIAMNHLRSGKFIMADFDVAKAETALERLLSAYRGVELEVFVKQHPDAYQNKCIRHDRTDQPPRLCPGLQHCHPSVWASYHDPVGFAS